MRRLLMLSLVCLLLVGVRIAHAATDVVNYTFDNSYDPGDGTWYGFTFHPLVSDMSSIFARVGPNDGSTSVHLLDNSLTDLYSCSVVVDNCTLTGISLTANATYYLIGIHDTGNTQIGYADTGTWGFITAPNGLAVMDQRAYTTDFGATYNTDTAPDPSSFDYIAFTTTPSNDTTPPNVTNPHPINGSSFAQFTTINVNASMTDDTALATEQVIITYPNASTEQRTLSLITGTTYGRDFVLTQNGTYLFVFNATDTSGNENSSVQTSILVTTSDTTPPSVTNPQPPNNTAVFTGSTHQITVDVTDPSGIASVTLTILPPSLTPSTFSMVALNSSTYGFNETFSAAGQYHFTFNATDTVGNSNATTQLSLHAIPALCTGTHPPQDAITLWSLTQQTVCQNVPTLLESAGLQTNGFTLTLQNVSWDAHAGLIQGNSNVVNSTVYNTAFQEVGTNVTITDSTLYGESSGTDSNYFQTQHLVFQNDRWFSNHSVDTGNGFLQFDGVTYVGTFVVNHTLVQDQNGTGSFSWTIADAPSQVLITDSTVILNQVYGHGTNGVGAFSLDGVDNAQVTNLQVFVNESDNSPGFEDVGVFVNNGANNVFTNLTVHTATPALLCTEIETATPVFLNHPDLSNCTIQVYSNSASTTVVTNPINMTPANVDMNSGAVTDIYYGITTHVLQNGNGVVGATVNASDSTLASLWSTSTGTGGFTTEQPTLWWIVDQTGASYNATLIHLDATQGLFNGSATTTLGIPRLVTITFPDMPGPTPFPARITTCDSTTIFPQMLILALIIGIIAFVIGLFEPHLALYIISIGMLLVIGSGVLMFTIGCGG